MEIDLKTDSRKVKPGDTFIAIRNVNRDGHDYIPQAIKNGATKVIVEEVESSGEFKKKEIMMLKLLLLKIQEHI